MRLLGKALHLGSVPQTSMREATPSRAIRQLTTGIILSAYLRAFPLSANLLDTPRKVQPTTADTMELIQSFIDALPSANLSHWGAAEISVFAPVIVYWMLALLYESLDTFGLFQQYKILQDKEFEKNKVTKLEVVRGVLVNHAIILFFGAMFFALEPDAKNLELDDPFGITQSILKSVNSDISITQNMKTLIYGVVLLCRMLAGMFVYDTWQYWVHLMLHQRWAYSE